MEEALTFTSVTLGGIAVVLATLAGAHVVLRKEDVRSAVGWIGFILTFPIVGPLAYFTFGINRIQRRARRLGGDAGTPASARAMLRGQIPEAAVQPAMPASRFASLAYLVGQAAKRPLVGGNLAVPLRDGDEAYPAMLAAIASAEHSVALSTYIFDRDETGLEFVEALHAAASRGVAVRVIVDAFGLRYSMPSILRDLRARGLSVARFMPGKLSGLPHVNLRTHRKLLVADGRVAFLGGINIRDGHRIARGPKQPVQDLHFRLEGPIVLHLVKVFAGDWLFTTGERLQGPAWFPDDVAPAGPVLSRVIADGPDEDLGKTRWTILGALAAAQSSIRIVTPYFLPEADLLSGLGIAAMRGIDVKIVLPSRSNLPYVEWAATAHLPQTLVRGCQVFATPPPFDHTKLMLVDDHWALVGSSNWDPRSLRLNFELNVELYDDDLGARLRGLVDAKLAAARPVTIVDLLRRPLPVRLRDGIARLALPYL